MIAKWEGYTQQRRTQLQLETLTRGLGCYSAVTKLNLQWRHNDGAGARAVAHASAGPLQKGPAIALESAQVLGGIRAAQGGVRVGRVIDSDVADDIGPCLQARAEEKKIYENSTSY